MSAKEEPDWQGSVALGLLLGALAGALMFLPDLQRQNHVLEAHEVRASTELHPAKQKNSLLLNKDLLNDKKTTTSELFKSNEFFKTSTQALDLELSKSKSLSYDSAKALATEFSNASSKASAKALTTEDSSAQESDGQIFEYWKTVRAKVTAYTPGPESCEKFADGFTSTGRNAWLSGVAVDPRAVPYGCYVDIPDVGLRLVDDTGSAMRKAWRDDGIVHIDLRFEDLKSAKEWGVRELNVDLFRPIAP